MFSSVCALLPIALIIDVSRNRKLFMGSLETTIEDCLFEYIQIILRFEKALIDTYNLEDNPYQCQSLFPRVGTMRAENEVFVYRYHGAGCSFDCSDLEVHYDYHISEPDYIVTVPWKFWRFVVTYLAKKCRPEITIEEVEEMLEKLNGKGVIQKVHPDYLQYHVSFSWFETYVPLADYG